MIQTLDLQEIMVVSGGMLNIETGGSRAPSEASALVVGSLKCEWHAMASKYWMPISLVAVGVIVASTIVQHYVTEKWQTYFLWAGTGIASVALILLNLAQAKRIAVLDKLYI